MPILSIQRQNDALSCLFFTFLFFRTKSCFIRLCVIQPHSWAHWEAYNKIILLFLVKRIILTGPCGSYGRLISTVCFQMFPQIICSDGCVLTLVAFACLFSTVCFQMWPQSACMSGCITTLVEFVWLITIMLFQMCPQTASKPGSIVTLIASVWFFSAVCFQMSHQIGCPG